MHVNLLTKFYFGAYLWRKDCNQSWGSVSILFPELTCCNVKVLHCFAPCTRMRSVKCSSGTAGKVDRRAWPLTRTRQRIEHELLRLDWASAARTPSFMHFQDGIRAVWTLCGLLTERSQRFDSRELRFIHLQFSDLFSSIYQYHTQQNSLLPRVSASGWIYCRPTSKEKKTREKEQALLRDHHQNCKEQTK